MESTLADLTNPEFSIKIGDKEFVIRKATLRQTISFQEKIKELSDNNTVAANMKSLSYAYWLILKNKYPEISEDILLDTLPGDLDFGETLVMLGFMNPQQIKISQMIEETLKKKLNETTTGESL
jgi:hypothetical protein